MKKILNVENMRGNRFPVKIPDRSTLGLFCEILSDSGKDTLIRDGLLHQLESIGLLHEDSLRCPRGMNQHGNPPETRYFLLRSCNK